MVAGLLKQFRIGGQSVGEDAPQVPGTTEAPVPLPRQDRSARWGTRWRRDIGMVEENALLRQAVEGRGLDHRVAIGTGMRPAPIIGDGEENVRLLWRGLGGNRSGQEQRCERYGEGKSDLLHIVSTVRESREAASRPVLLRATHYSLSILPPIHEEDDSRFETIHRGRL